ncbi:MAG: extracellular solute-binding protein [Qingshengfaniella sp.]
MKSALSIAITCGAALAGAAHAQDKVNLEYWVYSDFAQGEALKLQETFIAEFEAAHPGVSIAISGKGDDDLTAGQVAGAMSGSGPDVFMNATSAGAALVRAGALKNIYGDWMAMPEDFRAEFTDDLIDVCRPAAETLYCLPYTGYGSFMYRNLHVLAEAGIDPAAPITHWSVWMDQIRQIGETGKSAIPDEAQVWPSVAEIYSGIANDDEWGADFANDVTRINPEKFAQAGQLLLDMAPYTSGTSRNDQATRDLFISNQLAFYITGPWVNPTFVNAGMVYGQDYDWVLVPGATAEQQGGIKGHEFIAVAPKDHADIAWEFAAYVAAKEQQIRWSTLLGRYVANAAALSDPEVQANPLLAITNQATEKALYNQAPFFVEPYPNDYWSELADMATAIAQGDVTPEEGAAELVENLNEILADR